MAIFSSHHTRRSTNDRLRGKLTHANAIFYRALPPLDRFADKDGWFWHTDKSFNTRQEKSVALKSMVFGPQPASGVRKRLAALGLIETKQGSPEHGHWPGTQYRIYPHISPHT